MFEIRAKHEWLFLKLGLHGKECICDKGIRILRFLCAKIFPRRIDVLLRQMRHGEDVGIPLKSDSAAHIAWIDVIGFLNACIFFE